jgi:hypothetical protein
MKRNAENPKSAPKKGAPFALSYLIASIALIAVGIETKGRVLEEITQAKPA